QPCMPGWPGLSGAKPRTSGSTGTSKTQPRPPDRTGRPPCCCRAEAGPAAIIVLMSFATRRTVLLVQLPIPPLGPAPIRGNVPLAPAYLRLFAERKGLADFYDIEVFAARQANALGDQALVAALAARDPWLVGFTCYLWTVARTL